MVKAFINFAQGILYKHLESCRNSRLYIYVRKKGPTGHGKGSKKMEANWQLAKSLITDHRGVQVFLIFLGSVLVAFLVNMLIKRVILKLAAKTKTEFDNRIIEKTRSPIFAGILLIGASSALQLTGWRISVVSAILNPVKSIVIIVWAIALGRIADLIFKWMEGLTKFKIIQPRTVPIFDIFSIIIIWGGAIYMVLLVWQIDVTGWLASAGVFGIAVGFAAKDSLANLFSGFFILADAPYKLGDYIVLDSGERGVVTDIGIRSTRILTRDEIEIIVPNAVIANNKITNESGGPYAKERVRCTITVAYGTDIDALKEILMAAAHENDLICDYPTPRVRFRSFGESGLVFQLLGWIEEPVLRGRALDSLNTAVYNKLQAAGIEIPYPKRDIYLKETPDKSPALADMAPDQS